MDPLASPLFVAFRDAKEDIFDDLLKKNGAAASLASPDANGAPILIHFLMMLEPDFGWKRRRTEDMADERHYGLISRLFAAAKELLSLRWANHDEGNNGDVISDLLWVAIATGNARLVEILIDAGAEICTQRINLDGPAAGVIIPSRKPLRQYPTISVALSYPNLEVLKVLLEKGKAMKGWRERYDELSRSSVAAFLGSLAGATMGDHEHECRAIVTKMGWRVFRPADRPVLEYFFANSEGFDHAVREDGSNVALVGYWSVPAAREEKKKCKNGRNVSDKAALEILRRFVAAGFDITCRNKGDAASLVHRAADFNSLTLLDYAIEELGLPADEVAAPSTFDPVTSSALSGPPENEEVAWGDLTPFSTALSENCLDVARRLLFRYKAQVSLPSLPWKNQPVHYLLLSSFTEDQTLDLLKVFVERDPELFLKHKERNLSIGEDLSSNPLVNGLMKPACLDYLLSPPVLPGIRELCCARGKMEIHAMTPFGAQKISAHVHLGNVAAVMRKWNILRPVLNLNVDNDEFSVLREDRDLVHLYQAYRVSPTAKPSIAGLVMDAASKGGTDAPSRSLVAFVLSRAKAEKLKEKEREQEQAQAAAKGAGGTLTTTTAETATAAATSDTATINSSSTEGGENSPVAGCAAGAGFSAPAPAESAESAPAAAAPPVIATNAFEDPFFSQPKAVGGGGGQGKGKGKGKR